MSPAQRLVIGGIVIVTLAGGFAAGRALFRPSERVIQPIAFNHEQHVSELEIDCETCHEYFASADHSGLPPLSTCLVCHEDALTESAEEQKIRDLAAAGEDDVFRKLFRMPDHVYYSHRRHALLGEIACERCHGDVAATVVPPERPLRPIDMDFCTDCHESEGAAMSCTACHR